MKARDILPWIAAVLLGALAPAVMAAVVFDIGVFLPALVITLGHAVVLGVPVALFYQVRRWTNLAAAIAGGFVVGALPGAVFLFPVDFSRRFSASVDGVATVVNGIPTLAGWLEYLETLALLGSFGAAGGLAFWLTLWRSGTLPTASRVAP